MTSLGWISSRAVICLLLVTACLGSLPAEAAGPSLEPSVCYTSQLEWSLGWATSGAWVGTTEDRHLVIADASRASLIRFEPDGKVMNQIRRYRDIQREVALGVLRRPRTIRPDPNDDPSDGIRNFWVNNRGDEPAFLKLDREQNLHRRMLSVPADKGAERPIAGSYTWSPLDSGVVALVARKLPQLQKVPGERPQYEFSFVYYDADGVQGEFYTIKGKSDEERFASRLQYLLGMQTVTTIGSRSYILLVHEDPVRIIEVQAGVDGFRELDQVQKAGFGARPRVDWEEGSTLNRHYLAYQRIEGSRTPIALHSWGDSLYLLVKEAAGAPPARDTRWWVLQLSPATGEVLSRTELPTSAPHLTAVPGEHWAFIEKGPVQLMGTATEPWGDHPYMETHSMVLVPATWLDSGERVLSDESCAILSQ